LTLVALGAVSAVNLQQETNTIQDPSSGSSIPQIVLLSAPESPLILAQADTHSNQPYQTTEFSLESVVNKALNNEPLTPESEPATEEIKQETPKTLEELVNMASSNAETTDTSSDYISQLNSEVETTVVISSETAQKPATVSEDMSDAEKLQLLDKINQTIAQDNSQTSDNVRYIKVRENDSLWLIAEREYGDPYQYKLLYHANKDLLSNENSLVVGQKIRIPQINTE